MGTDPGETQSCCPEDSAAKSSETAFLKPGDVSQVATPFAFGTNHFNVEHRHDLIGIDVLRK
jgi:hypothetical protein